MQSLTLKRKIKLPFASPLQPPSPQPSLPPPPVTPNTIHTFNTQGTDDAEEDQRLLSTQQRDNSQRQPSSSASTYSAARDIPNETPTPSLSPEPSVAAAEDPAPLQPRSPTRTLPRRRNSASTTTPAPPLPHPPSKKPSSDMSLATSSTNHHPTNFLRKHRMSPSRDSWSSTTLDSNQGGTYTSDLADFLRSTGPVEPPSSSSQPTPDLPQAATATTASSSSSQPKSGFTFRKYLKKSSNSSLGKKDASVPAALPNASTPSLAAGKRRVVTDSFSGSAAVTAAVNKALHNVPPPTNVQPKVFANGHTIYMINTPPHYPSTPNPPPPALPSSQTQTQTPSHSQRTITQRSVTNPSHKPISPAASYAATISRAANYPKPPPPPPLLRSPASFHGSSHASSSATVTPRPKTSGADEQSSTTPIPPVPPLPSRQQQLETEKQQPPNALQPPMEDYDIQFESSADERTPGAAEIDGSDLDPTLSALSRRRRAGIVRPPPGLVETDAEGDDEDDEEIQWKNQSPRTGSGASALSKRSGASSHRYTGSNASVSVRRSESSARSSPTAPRQLPPPTTALPAIPQPNANVNVGAAPPSTPHVVRDRAGSEGVVFGGADMYRRDRSVSATTPKRASVPVGLGLGSPPPPLNPPPAVPPPPTPGQRSVVRSVVASEASRSTIRRAVKARPTVVLSDQFAERAGVAETKDDDDDALMSAQAPPTIARSSIQYILDPKTAPPVPSNPGERGTFGGYVFPAAAESSGSEVEKDESEDDNDNDPTRKLDSPSHSSVYLKEQLETVMKMNDAYLELATADKKARRESRPMEVVGGLVVDEEKTPVLGSPAEFPSTSTSADVGVPVVKDKAESTRTVSVGSTRSGSSGVSVGRINAAFVASPNGPPRLPLPPSPASVPTGLHSRSPTQSLAPTSPLLPSGSPTSSVQPATTPQAQITTLTYALHTQRSRYEALSNHLCQQQAAWDDQRAAYETRLAEAEREKGDVVAEREQFAKRLQELEKELAERDARVSVLEAEKFAWERERKGLRWLVTSGRSAPSAAKMMSRSSTSGSIGSFREAARMQAADSDVTAFGGEEDGFEGALPASESDQTLRIDITEVNPLPGRSNNSSSTAPSRPLSMMSTTSQASATSSRTSLDDGLLHPRLAVSSSSNKLKRHSMYEAATIATPTSMSRRPLSAALEDMLQSLRSLGEEENDSSPDESAAKRGNGKKTLSVGMTSSRSTPLFPTVPKAEPTL